MKFLFRTILGLFVATMLSSVQVSAAPLDGTFTYQGQLTDGGLPITGTVDVRFRLWDAAAAGLQVGATIDMLGLAVTDGLFKADLNFGVDALSGDMRWLEISVQNPAGVGGYVNLGRQEMLGSPYSIQTRGIFVDDLLNVGIGTTTPAGRFQVTNPANGRSLLSFDIGSIYDFGQTAPNGNYSVGYGTFSAGELGQIQFRDAAGVGLGLSAVIGSATPEGNGLLNLYGEGGSGDLNFQIRANPDTLIDGVSNTRMFIRSSGTGGIGGEFSVRNNDGAETLNLLGGTSGNGGTFSMFEPTLGTETVSLRSLQFGSGAGLRMNSEDGFEQFGVEPDSSGQGVFVRMKRNNISNGFVFDGNFNGTGNPKLTISGSARSAIFAMNSTGSSSVSLPTDAIQASEILDEPGVASSLSNGIVTLTGGIDTIVSRTITCPTNGYCVVIGSFQVNASHTAGVRSFSDFGVSNAAGVIPINQDVAYIIPSAAPSATYFNPITVHGTFSVNAGANTFYLMGRKNIGSFSINDMQLSVIFIPTAYGTVTSTLLAQPGVDNDASAPQMYPMSASDIYAEQVQAVDFDQNRRSAEAADYAQKFAELELRIRELEAQQDLSNISPRRASPPTVNTDSENGVAIGSNN